MEDGDVQGRLLRPMYGGKGGEANGGWGCLGKVVEAHVRWEGW